jgi:hypothetical protein
MRSRRSGIKAALVFNVQFTVFSKASNAFTSLLPN